LCEEHVFGAAKSDSLRSEAAGHLRITRDIRIGANAEFAPESIGPLHELAEMIRMNVRLPGGRLTLENFGGGAVDRNPVALLQRHFLAAAGVDRRRLGLLVDLHGARAHNAGAA